MIPSFIADVSVVLEPVEGLSFCNSVILLETFFLALASSSEQDTSCTASEEGADGGYSWYEQRDAWPVFVHCTQGIVLEHLSFFLLQSKQDKTGRGRFCGTLTIPFSGAGEDAESITSMLLGHKGLKDKGYFES
jgi:hypothetical protein